MIYKRLNELNPLSYVDHFTLTIWSWAEGKIENYSLYVHAESSSKTPRFSVNPSGRCYIR